MGQEQVFKLLEKKGEWMTTVEIAVKLKRPRKLVRRALNQMHKYHEILKMENRNKNKRGGDKWKIV